MPPSHPEELTGLDLYPAWAALAEPPATFDPFRWAHRMAAYRALIVATNAGGRFGVDNRLNPLWGLMFQLHWQVRTGRLGDSARVDGRIDPDSAWGYGNYTLCILPWLGAERAGMVAPRRIADPATASRFRYVRSGAVPVEFERGIEAWRVFFVEVARAQRPSPRRQSEPVGPDAEDEQIRMTMWHAHKCCLDLVAARTLRDVPGPLPQAELDFLRGWCRMVDFLWAAAFPTHFDFTVAHGLDVLPEVMLSSPAMATQLPERAAGNAANVLGLARAGPLRTRLSLWLWRRAMRTPQARADVLALLDAAFHRRRDNAATRRRLLWLVLVPRPGWSPRSALLRGEQASGRGASPPPR